ncbi:type II secretion system F family protein [Mobilicoccus pelagius]|uniref:type II secretion system F family protein n=1 Tax=Mobilicoccus pelagius TaxID=746032 RepID=UPI0002DE5254|nr:type II secretion system F family protein [Mobilicoccus pelagius]
MTVLVAAVLTALAVALAHAAGVGDGGVLPLTGRGGRLSRLLPEVEQVPTPAVEIADVADLLTLVLLSGRGVTSALTVVSDRLGGRLGADLGVVVAARAWGLDDEHAWATVDPAWEPVARALVLAEAAGVPPSTTLAAAAEDIRRTEEHRLEVATERLGVRLVLPLGLTFLPAFVATTVVPVVSALAGTVLRG